MNTNTGELINLTEPTSLPYPWVEVATKNLPHRQQHELAIRGKSKLGRNDPCPCGSGKKFKKCCHTP